MKAYGRDVATPSREQIAGFRQQHSASLVRELEDPRHWHAVCTCGWSTPQAYAEPRPARQAGCGHVVDALRQDLADPDEANAHDEAARKLVAVKERIYTLNSRNADLARTDLLAGADLDEVLALADELDAACEEFRRRFYPRLDEVFTALGSVCTTSYARRRTEIVYDARAAVRDRA